MRVSLHMRHACSRLAALIFPLSKVLECNAPTSKGRSFAIQTPRLGRRRVVLFSRVLMMPHGRRSNRAFLLFALHAFKPPVISIPWPLAFKRKLAPPWFGDATALASAC